MTKKCKSCQQEIDVKATKCPHCQTDQRNWFIKHPIWSIILVLFILGIFGSIVGSATNKGTSVPAAPDSANTTRGTTAPNNVSPTQSNRQPTELTPKVGDITKLGDREFIVNSVRRSGAFNYNTPDTGKEYVIVNVTIQNLGKDEVTYNPYDFKVQDANGAQEGEAFASLGDSLNSGTLAAGGKVTGSMAFQVPVGSDAKLLFEPNFFTSERIMVDLGNK